MIDAMGTISRDFSYKEFEVTDIERLKIANVIRTIPVRDSIKVLVEDVLQPLRDAWKAPLSINSGYRCEAVNKAVDGSPTSQHLKGEAADVCPSFCRNDSSVSEERVFALAQMAKDLHLPFDQMILYPHFVHFSHSLNGVQRGEILYSKTYRGKRF